MSTPSWIFYFTVPAIDAAAERVTEAGGQIINGPMEVPGAWVLQCLDPQGAMFALTAAER
jgi:predicted enzyme related to lactoylglutathione lyase